MKTAVITVDFKENKVLVDFFEGKNCWKAAENFRKSIEKDFPKPRYNVIISRDLEANNDQKHKLWGIK